MNWFREVQLLLYNGTVMSKLFHLKNYAYEDLISCKEENNVSLFLMLCYAIQCLVMVKGISYNGIVSVTFKPFISFILFKYQKRKQILII